MQGERGCFSLRRVAGRPPNSRSVRVERRGTRPVVRCLLQGCAWRSFFPCLLDRGRDAGGKGFSRPRSITRAYSVSFHVGFRCGVRLAILGAQCRECWDGSRPMAVHLRVCRRRRRIEWQSAARWRQNMCACLLVIQNRPAIFWVSDQVTGRSKWRMQVQKHQQIESGGPGSIDRFIKSIKPLALSCFLLFPLSIV